MGLKMLPLSLPILTLLVSGPVLQEQDPLASYRAAAVARWGNDIRRLEALDSQEQHPENAVLFVGSSSIKRWATLAEDMAPWPTIRRGYGGARFSDLAVFLDRLVNPHQFSALVIFVGNDIAGKPEDKSPEEVVAIFEHMIAEFRKKYPSQPIFLLAVTPTSSRLEVWPVVNRMNGMLDESCSKQPNVFFLKTADRFLDANGKPKDELFIADRLHLNREGYRIWAEILKSELERVLKVSR
jgi:lysophospholipase L1-like esterase